MGLILHAHAENMHKFAQGISGNQIKIIIDNVMTL